MRQREKEERETEPLKLFEHKIYLRTFMLII